MGRIFRLAGTRRCHPEVEAWVRRQPAELQPIAAGWVARLRACGPDVEELMHDGYATFCVDNAAFAYVGAFKAHVSVGFFNGAALADPTRLLEGAGQFMRHVKLRPGLQGDARALQRLLDAAYQAIKAQLTPQ